MRVWLAAFVLLFAIIELFEWFAQLGSWQPTGMWLILGGMGLAALSNASQLSATNSAASNSIKGDSTIETQQSNAQPVAKQQKATPSKQAVAPQISETKSQKVAASLTDESDKDSISFKVRPLKR
ncbi:MAG: hypothetical protein AAFQ63_23075 [Cyanobacteria bacterium J06621_11]